MTEAWIQLSCPDCGKDWEAAPSDLPDLSEDFSCPDCQKRHSVSEFTRTQRDFEILEDLQEI